MASKIKKEANSGETKKLKVNSKDNIEKVVSQDKKTVVTGNKSNSVRKKPVVRKVVQEETDTKSNNKINIINNNSNDFNIFENIDNSDTYVTYHVYIVKEDDTIDSILDKYGVTKEDLSNYNDITNIKPKDKIIIPNKNE